jgi:hypothetical protein
MDQHNLVDPFKMEKQMDQDGSADTAMHSSPLHRMPTEILCEIIKAYLFDDGDITVIIQICRRIRQVVFNMSNVWNHILLFSTPYYQPLSYRAVRL